jgi:hypothetical protein
MCLIEPVPTCQPPSPPSCRASRFHVPTSQLWPGYGGSTITSLTPLSTALREKLIVVQLVNKFPVFYGTRRFNTIRFQVLTAASMKRLSSGMFRLVLLQNLTGVSEVLTDSGLPLYDHQLFRSRLLIALMIEAVSTFEMSVSVHQTTRRNIPENSHLYSLPCSQQPTTGPYPETVESSSEPHLNESLVKYKVVRIRNSVFVDIDHRLYLIKLLCFGSWIFFRLQVKRGENRNPGCWTSWLS